MRRTTISPSSSRMSDFDEMSALFWRKATSRTTSKTCAIIGIRDESVCTVFKRSETLFSGAKRACNIAGRTRMSSRSGCPKPVKQMHQHQGAGKRWLVDHHQVCPPSCARVPQGHEPWCHGRRVFESWKAWAGERAKARKGGECIDSDASEDEMGSTFTNDLAARVAEAARRRREGVALGGVLSTPDDGQRYGCGFPGCRHVDLMSMNPRSLVRHRALCPFRPVPCQLRCGARLAGYLLADTLRVSAQTVRNGGSNINAAQAAPAGKCMKLSCRGWRE